jgi:hypothetical protein
MISFAGYRTGFPFPLRHRSANGLPFEAWDGSTLDITGVPTASSGADVYGIGTGHPVGLTISQMAELFWRVRKLRVDFDYTTYWDSGGGSGSYSGSGLESPMMNPPHGEVTFEAGLIREGSNMGHYAAEIIAPGSSVLEVGYKGEWQEIWKINDLYYPYVRLGLGGRFTVVSPGDAGGALGNPVTGLEVNFLDIINLPFWGSNMLATVGQDPPYSGTGTIEIVADAWWPYDGKFDPDDGSRL